MKNKWFEWQTQLFADDEDENENPEGAEGKEGDEGKESENEKTFSQDEVNKLIADRLARESAKLKKEAEKDAKAAAEKAVKEAEKKAKMDAEEKEKYEREELQKKIDELTAYQTRTELSKTVTSMLAEKEIVATDGLQKLLIGADEDDTRDKVDAFIKEVEAAADRKVKEMAKGKTPKTGDKKPAAQEPKTEIEKRLAKYKKKEG